MNILQTACVLLSLLAGSPATGTGRPGDGGDSDPTTFSFHSDNRIAPLLDESGVPLKAEDVAVDYGRRYAVLSDGVDVCSLEYAWAAGRGGDHPVLQPRHQDLSRWEEARVENGWLAVDPRTGRFKFAGENRVADPLRLEHRKQIVLGNLTMWRLAAKGKFAFTSGEEETHAVQAFDATDPAHFRYAGYSSAGGYSTGLAIGETCLYVAGSGYLSVHDIRDPRAIHYIKSIANGGLQDAFEIAIDLPAKRLYQNSPQGLLVYDIAKEDDPVLVEIHDGLRLPFLQPWGDFIFGLESEESPNPLFTTLVAYRKEAGDRLAKAGELRLAGLLKSERQAIRHLLVHDGLAFVVLSTGLHVVDVRDPAAPKRISQVYDLGPVKEYYEKGSGAHDMAVHGGLLYVACGRSTGGWVNPRETGLFRDHIDFEEKVRRPGEARDIPQRYRGGLRIYDLADPAHLRLVGRVDDEVLGLDAITDVAIGDGVLFLGSRLVGVIAFDLSDPRKPRYLGNLSAMGEVDWARLVGDKLYAVSNGLYVIEPYPAEEARLLSFAFMNGFLFGRSITGNPFPAQNPGKFLFAATNTCSRQFTVADPARPLMTRYGCPVGYGRWKGNHIFAPGDKALDVWRVEPDGDVRRVLGFPVEGPSTHLEIHGDRLFLFGLSKDTSEPIDYLRVFDISNPEKPKLVTRLKGLPDTGGMFSPDVFYYRGFLFLPGWQSARLAGGGFSFGNFLGIRVIDVRKPDEPKVHCLIHHIPPDIAVESLTCANSFHASGDILYVADYWHGIHVFDISDLAEKKAFLHLGVVKDRRFPWSVASYAPGVTGYGRYLYTTHFGHVNIWEIAAPSDVPRGALSVRKLEKVVRR
jgi:hypothetical protein